MKFRFRAHFRLAAILWAAGVVLVLDFTVKQVANTWKRPTVTLAAVPESTNIPPMGHRFFSPDFHHGFVPLSRGWETYGPFRVEYLINSLGMRDGAMRMVAAQVDTPRILIMGDSYIDGVGLAYRDTMVGQLAAQLPGVEVLNGGVASYCPSLIRDRLRAWIQKDGLRFKMLIVYIDISDTENELSYAKDETDRYQREWSSSFTDFRKNNLSRDQRFRLWLQDSVEKNFVLLGAGIRNMRILYESAGCPGGTMDWDYAKWPSYRGPLEPWIRKSLDQQSRAMEEVLAFCRIQGATLVVAVYPWLQQVRRDQAEDRYTRFWQEWCSTRQVKFLNLYPEFLVIRPSFREYVLANEDSHWNARGSEVASRATLNFLKQKGLLNGLLPHF